MNRSRVTGDLASHGNIFVDIANDRVGIGSTIPAQKLSLPDSAKIALGNSADLQLFHDGTHSRINNSTGYIAINNSADLISITGSNRIDISDNFIRLRSRDGSDVFMTGTQNAAVDLYHDGTKKFETTAYGIDVTGTTGTDGLAVSGVATATTFSGSGASLTNLNGSNIASGTVPVARIGTGTKDTTTFYRGDGTFQVVSTDLVGDTSPQLGGNLDVQASKITTSTSNGNIQIEPNGSGVLEVRGAGGNDGTLQLNCSAQSHGIKLKSPPHSAAQSYTLTFPSSIVNNGFLKTDSSGNLSFAAVNTDLSNDTSPQLGGDLDTNSHHILIDDDHEVKFGASNDLRIMHANGNANFIQSYNDNNLRIHTFGTSAQVKLQTNESQDNVVCKPNGATELYHSGNKKFETTSSGAAITGNLSLSADDPTLNLIDTNNNNFAIKANTGILYITDATNNATRASMTAGGAWTFQNNITVTKTGDPILTVTGSGHAQLTLTSTSGSDHCGVNFGDSSDHNAGMIQYTNNGDYMVFHTAGAERFRINSTGTTTFKGDSTGTEQIKIESNGGGAGIFIGNFQGVDAGDASSRLGVGKNDNALIFMNASGSQVQNFAIGTTDAVPLVFSTANTQRLLIASNGKIGINIAGSDNTSPVRNLDIADASGAIIRLVSTDDSAGANARVGEIEFYTNDDDAAHVSSNIKAIQDPSDAYGRRGALIFGTRSDSGDATEKMRIDHSGKVGINQTDIDADLHIATKGSSEQDGTLKIGGSENSLGLSLTYDQAGATVSKITANPTYTHGSALLKICVDGDANADQLVLSGAGKIGINIADNTAADLQVRTGTNGAGVFRLGGSNGNGVGMDATYSNSGNTSTVFKQNYRSTNAGALMKFDSGYFTFHTGTIADERLRIDSVGRIGINATPSVSHEYLTVKPVGNNVLDIAYRLNSSTDIRHKHYSDDGTYRGGFNFTRYSNSTRYPNLHYDHYWVTNPTGTSTQVSMRLTREGYLLQQYIPAFGVAKTDNSGQIGSGVYVFNEVHFNNGSHYSTSNGRFTAPKAGAYFFCFSLQLYGSNAAHARFQINGSDVFSNGTSGPIYEDGADSHETMTHGMVLNLAQGDYVTVTKNNNTRGMQSSFCGHLIG